MMTRGCAQNTSSKTRQEICLSDLILPSLKLSTRDADTLSIPRRAVTRRRGGPTYEFLRFKETYRKLRYYTLLK